MYVYVFIYILLSIVYTYSGLSVCSKIILLLFKLSAEAPEFNEIEQKKASHIREDCTGYEGITL